MIRKQICLLSAVLLALLTVPALANAAVGTSVTMIFT